VCVFVCVCWGGLTESSFSFSPEKGKKKKKLRRIAVEREGFPSFWEGEGEKEREGDGKRGLVSPLTL
jgi:hypothetical protein